MLGVRHYGGCAIDLWLGDATKFVCDYRSDDLTKGLEISNKAHARHFAFTPQPIAREIMPQIKNFLDTHANSDAVWPKRITIVSHEPGQYKKFQQELFSSFPTQ